MVEEGSRGDAIATFVIRIRLEESETQKKRQRWVAHITNVLEHSEDWVDDLEGVRRYFENALLRMGATPKG